MPTLMLHIEGGLAEVEASDLEVDDVSKRAKAIVALNHAESENDPVKKSKRKRGISKRGPVKGMSQRARNNYLVEIAQLDWGRISQAAIEITFTYPDIFPDDPKVWRKDRSDLAQWFRDHFPQFGAVWVIDLKIRKSGVKKGQLAPHLHILVYLPGVKPDQLEQWVIDTKEELAKYWHKKVGNKDENHRKEGVYVEILNDREHVKAFLRYMAKMSSKRAAKYYPEGTGKTWDTWRKENLPKSPKIEIQLTEEWFYEVEKYMKAQKWGKVVEDRHFSSLRCFVDDFSIFLNG